MSAFGQTLFGGSPFVRWTLSPFLLVFAIFMPFALDLGKWEVVLALGGLEFLCLALLAGFWLPERWGRVAFRMVCGGVFVTYLAYLIHSFFFSDIPFQLFMRRGESGPRNALLGFFVIGLPCLWYALFGRFSFQGTGEAKKIPQEKTQENPQEKILVIQFGGWTGIRLKWIPKNEMVFSEDGKTFSLIIHKNTNGEIDNEKKLGEITTNEGSINENKLSQGGLA